MPSNEPAETKEPATQAEDLDTWLRAHDKDPDRYTQHSDGSVSIKILYPCQKKEDSDPAGPKIVKLRPMYGSDFRALSKEFGGDATADEANYQTTLRLSSIEAYDLERLHLVDYDAVLAAAQGVLEKKFRPTS